MNSALSKAIQGVIDCWTKNDGRVSMNIMAELIEARNQAANGIQMLKCIDAEKSGGELVVGRMYPIISEGSNHYRVAEGGRKWGKYRFILTTLD